MIELQFYVQLSRECLIS